MISEAALQSDAVEIGAGRSRRAERLQALLGRVPEELALDTINGPKSVEAHRSAGPE